MTVLFLWLLLAVRQSLLIDPRVLPSPWTAVPPLVRIIHSGLKLVLTPILACVYPLFPHPVGILVVLAGRLCIRLTSVLMMQLGFRHRVTSCIPFGDLMTMSSCPLLAVIGLRFCLGAGADCYVLKRGRQCFLGL